MSLTDATYAPWQSSSFYLELKVIFCRLNRQCFVIAISASNKMVFILMISAYLSRNNFDFSKLNKLSTALASSSDSSLKQLANLSVTTSVTLIALFRFYAEWSSNCGNYGIPQKNTFLSCSFWTFWSFQSNIVFYSEPPNLLPHTRILKSHFNFLLGFEKYCQ